MDFGANKMPVEVIREGAFGGTCFRDIYSDVTGKWYKKSWKNSISWKILIRSFIVQIIMMLVLINMVLRFWENKGWINEIDPYGWFQWYFRYWLSRRSKDDERQINRWKKIVSRFRGKLVKMIKDAGSKFDDYSISVNKKTGCLSNQ